MKKGKVYLAGAGPGDPGLITVAASQILNEADAVVYDGLVNPVLVAGLPAKKWNVSKHFPVRTARHGADQAQINRLLLKLARQGKTVVRLKGGDPFVFGRGGEEASFLKKHRVPFEIISGVSAGHAVPAYAGIPVTDRRRASSVTFVTSHEAPSKQEVLNWSAVARLGGTLVFFMGWKNLKEVSARLMAEGLSARTPGAAIQWGTMPEQKTVEGTLGDLASKVQRAGLKPPALIVIGQTAGLRRSLKWFEAKPLFGRKIVITRPERQNASLRLLLQRQGAEVLECPSIRILPPKSFRALDKALRQLRQYDAVLFTSTNAVDAFFERLSALGRDARALAQTAVIAMGPATTAALKSRGVRADHVPPQYETRALVRYLKKGGLLHGKHYLLPRTDIAPEELKKSLESCGTKVTAVTSYRTVQDVQLRRTIEQAAARQPDFVLFASASAARYFFKALPRRFWSKMKNRLVSIGPATTRALQSMGLRPCLEARSHTSEGLVAILAKQGPRKKNEKK